MKPRAIALAVLLACALTQCGDDTLACLDNDLDGYGMGCDLGADCDDTNPLRNIRCDGEGPDCGVDPQLTGCACLPGSAAECFPGIAESIGVGMCVGGRSRCVNGYWGLCEGAIGPQGEFCDGSDQDCDGEIDEGVASPCGGCTPGCIGGVWGEGNAPFAPGEETDVTTRGWLTLRFTELSEGQVWIANSDDSTVSRIDGTTLEESGRYSVGRDPSRVAVNYDGDAWVLGRNFGGVGEIMLVAGDMESCIDANESGSIETSSGSDLVDDDECILRRADVGGVGDLPRALAVDGNGGLDGTSGGDLWIGLHDAERIVHLDGLSLEVLDTIDIPGFQPYAFAFDSQGLLWGISRDGFLLSLDRFDLAAAPQVREVPIPCFELYGLAVDDEGRVAMTGFGCDQVTVYDPIADHYVSIATPPSPRGAVTSGTSLFVAHTSGLMSELVTHPLRLVSTRELGDALESIGIGVTDSHVWIASARGHISGAGLATAVSRNAGATVELPVGRGPHTQGDLTGAKRRGAFVDRGAARHLFRGCADGATDWGTLRVTANFAGGTITVNARHGESEDALGEFETLLIAEDGNAMVTTTYPNGGVVEIEAILETPSRDAAPRLRRIGYEWACPGPM
ncbi:MAG: hypothetical protein ACI9KE_000979 [Polyangiales bacterium]